MNQIHDTQKRITDEIREEICITNIASIIKLP